MWHVCSLLLSVILRKYIYHKLVKRRNEISVSSLKYISILSLKIYEETVNSILTRRRIVDVRDMRKGAPWKVYCNITRRKSNSEVICAQYYEMIIAETRFVLGSLFYFSLFFDVNAMQIRC